MQWEDKLNEEEAFGGGSWISIILEEIVSLTEKEKDIGFGRKEDYGMDGDGRDHLWRTV